MKRITLSALLMTLFLLLSCGSGSSKAEDPQSRFLKSVISLSNDFLNVFTSLSDMVGGVLGFDTNTKKSDVGAYFKKVHDTVSSTKTTLEKIVTDMKSENNPNAEATGVAVKNLIDNTLDKIIQGAKTASEAIGSDASDPIANVATAGNDAAAGGVKGDGIENLVKGIKDLVEVVLGDKGNAEAGDANKASDGGSRTANAADGEAGKLFATGNGPAGDQNNSKKVATDAAKAVGAVTGADILQAMVKDGGAATLAKNSAEQVAGANAKDSVIAGGIVLRAIAKGGKFANGNNAGNADVATAIKGAAISAVTKALGTLTIAIRNTIDVGLKEVKGAIKINATDTPVTTDNTTSETKKN
ncbi:Variable large protein 5 (plasmid) [Borrelia turicatae]|uniref:Variable large protein n=1 Tax=Borrelia turicatae TaxID=142 RepID=A0A172XD76_BORTU|nr:variable large family protein [Borrelia turicatae]ANF34624.1 Variable large protein 5 [Borrelia turicatae]UPA15870.1 variable large family protein [Borrelia turicatae]